MGQAKVPVPTTDNFLKKHSKEPQLPESKLTISTNIAIFNKLLNFPLLNYWSAYI